VGGLGYEITVLGFRACCHTGLHGAGPPGHEARHRWSGYDRRRLGARKLGIALEPPWRGGLVCG
jgi:hypothetical protein